MMILSLICSVMFFLSAIILFMPKFRKYPFFKPFGVYMAYQGIWTLLSYIVNQLFPTNQVMTVFNYLGSFVFCVYFLFIFYMSRKGISKGKSKASKSKSQSDKTASKSRRTSLSRQKDEALQKKSSKKNRYSKPAKNNVSERYRDNKDNTESLYIKKSAAAEAETAKKSEVSDDINSIYGEYTEYGKKKNRFAENDKGSDKYTLSSDKEEIYENSSSYDDLSIDDDTSEDEELESINNIEITDEDLEYGEDEEDISDEENTDDVDLYDSLDDDFFDLESDKEEDLISDEDEYGDDLFSDYDDSEDEEEEDTPPKRGRRYKK